MLDQRVRSRVGLLTGVALALLLLAPVLGPGYVLVRDMVFVPRLPLGGQLLGRDGVPRGVPSELVVALASRVIATGWLQDALLLGLVIGGAWGAARLAPTTSRTGAVVAAATYGWSPYLHERLLLGQWALLVGWAVLPWAVRASLAWRAGHTGWWAICWLLVAALAGANALLLVGLAVVVCGRPGRALAATAVLALPWAVPGALQEMATGDRAGVSAFAANSDTPFGVLGSLLTGGGVWSSTAIPAGRSAGSALAVVVFVLALSGLRRVTTQFGFRLLLLAGAGLVLALLGRLPLAGDALRWAVVHVPASGLLRDGQKWVAPVVLISAVSAAAGVDLLLAKLAPGRRRALVTVLLALLPVAALPNAAWGEGGRLHSSHYPAAWERVTRQAQGAVLVLPWTLYRAFPWTHEQVVLDPAVKLLQRPVVNDALPLADRTVAGEDLLAVELDAAARAGTPLLPALRASGISQVLVERTTQGFDPVIAASQVRGLTVVADSSELTLLAVPGGGRPASRVAWEPLVLADLLSLAFASSALVLAWRRRDRRCRPANSPGNTLSAPVEERSESE